MICFDVVPANHGIVDQKHVLVAKLQIDGVELAPH